MKPSIIFIDEIDAIGRKRTKNQPNDALNQLLTEMDGFDKDDQVFVIGATNRLGALDSALLRPNRFDKIIQIPIPNDKSRKALIEHYMKKIKINDEKLDIEKLI